MPIIVGGLGNRVSRYQEEHNRNWNRASGKAVTEGLLCHPWRRQNHQESIMQLKRTNNMEPYATGRKPATHARFQEFQQNLS